LPLKYARKTLQLVDWLLHTYIITLPSCVIKKSHHWHMQISGGWKTQ